jgi:proline-specific peptidase
MEAEGYIVVPGGRVWYRSIGAGGVPLLCLHGGPGFTHNYIDSLADLADRRTVIFYDQLGCGRSDRPDDDSLWTVDRFEEELGAVCTELALDRFHLFGSSWGGMLATQYVLDHRPPVMSMILCGAPLDMPRYRQELAVLRDRLPDDVKAILDFHEDRGFFDCPEYQGAVAVFLRRHLCRMDPWPDGLERSFSEMGAASFRAMQGPSETAVTGNFKDFDVTRRLHEILVPVLITGGRFDNVPPEHAAAIHELLVGSELVIFENSGHMPFYEERPRYMSVVNEFLDRCESQQLA